MALSFVGASTVIATNGGAPTAITPHASTVDGDLLVWYHYSRATGGNETVTPPTGFTTIFNSVTANQGLVAAAYRFRQAGDTSHTASITNHTSGTSGETVLEWIETYRGADPTTPIGSFTAALSTWASSLNIGSISAPSAASLANRNWVVVFGGRFENVATQTTLTGDNLTWTARTRADTTQGLDAGAVTQTGANLTGSSQTVTAKTITTTGTAQAGAGRMFIINAAPPPTPPDPTGDVTFVDSTTTGDTQNVSSLNVPIPAGATTADVAVVRMSRWQSPPSGAGATMPPGFVHRNQLVAGDQANDTFVKRLTDAESGNWAFSWTGGPHWSTAHCVLYRGVDRDVDLTTLRVNTATSSGATYPDTALTDVPEGAALDWHGVNETVDSTTTTQPTGFTKVEDNDCDVSAYRESLTAGSYSATGAAPTTSSDSTLSSLLELPPEPVGGTTVTLGQATETDTARAVTATKAGTFGQAAETDTARPLAISKTATLGQPAETDTARAVTATKTATLSRPVETDAARPLTASKLVALGRATETDAARPLGVSAGQTVTLGQAAETDTARVLSIVKAAILGQPAETDTARPLTVSKVVTLGRATETDTAQPLATTGGLQVGLGTATETDSARALTISKASVLAGAAEADTARAVLVSKLAALGRAAETGAARALTATKTVILGRATETAVARPLSSVVPITEAVLTASNSPASVLETAPGEPVLVVANAPSSQLEVSNGV